MANDIRLDSAQPTEGLGEQTKVGNDQEIGETKHTISRRTAMGKILQGAAYVLAGSKVVEVVNSLTAAPQPLKTPTPPEPPKPPPSPTRTIGEIKTAEPQPTLPDLSVWSGEVAEPDPSLYSPEAAAIIKEIERTYNINIFSVQQAREYAHRYLSSEAVAYLEIDNWQDTKVGFDIEQLILLRELLSYIPEVQLTPEYPQRFGIILRENDLKDLEGHVLAGVAYEYTRMVAIRKDGINLQDRKGTHSLLIHEPSHSWDIFSKRIAWNRIRKLLGNKNFGDLPEMKAYFANKGGEYSSVYSTFDGAQKAALATFSSFALEPPGQKWGEGPAGLAQLYADGYLSFMNSVGPILDGNGYLSSDYAGNIDNAYALKEKYPKAQDLYDYYKQLFFGGMEYDATLLKAIEFGN